MILKIAEFYKHKENYNVVKIRQNHPNVKLRDQRRLQEWTQADVANKLGVTDLTVGRWERGEAVPFPYYQQKLCDLFGKTREELGLTSKPAVEQDQAPNEQNLEKPQEELHSEQILPLDIELPHMVRDEKKRHATFRTLNAKFVIMFVGLGLVLIAGSVSIFFNWGQTTSSVLYHTDWSNGPDQWHTSTDLHWSKGQGGVLKTASTIANTIVFAPYTNSTASYAVEAQIQRIGYAGLGGQAYGLTIEAASNSGYVCGVGVHFLPEHFFVAESHFTAIPPYWLTDLAHQPASLDNSWHTYRMEVRKNKITFSVDGKFIQSVDTPLYIPTGRVGLYIDNAAIIVKSFSVLALA